VNEEDGLRGKVGLEPEGVFYALLFCGERSIMACSSELGGKEVMGGGFSWPWEMAMGHNKK
jgi:hypothetical protein